MLTFTGNLRISHLNYGGDTFFIVCHYKTKCSFCKKVKQSLYRLVTGPEGSRRLRLLDFETFST